MATKEVTYCDICAEPVVPFPVHSYTVEVTAVNQHLTFIVQLMEDKDLCRKHMHRYVLAALDGIIIQITDEKAFFKQG